MKKSVFRKLVAALLTVVLIALTAAPAWADEILEGSTEPAETGMILPGSSDPKDSGECGDNVNYSYNKSTGIVTVSGTGATWDYAYRLGPNIVSRIFNVNGLVYTLKIESGITEIKERFIPESYTLVNIIIPKSVKKIGDYNFMSSSHELCLILYEGTKEEWNKITIEDSNHDLDDIIVLYKDEWYKDVISGKDFYFMPVYFASVFGITGGYGNGTFQPYASCSRAMIVTFLYRAAGSPDVAGTNQFSDVKPTDWYYKAVSWAVEKGITTGYGSGTFQPYASCSRAMIVTFLKRMYDPSSKPQYKNAFPDVPKGAWFTDAVMWAVQYGITTGKGGYFKPNDVCTRGEAVTFIYRLFTGGI